MMIAVALRRSSSRRWLILAGLIVALVSLGQLSLAATAGQPELGLRLVAEGPYQRVTWVQPAGRAWDAGVRSGDLVAGIDSSTTQQMDGSHIGARAVKLRVLTADGKVRDVSVAPAAPIARERRLSFLAIAGCFVVVGAIVFVLATDLLAASITLGFTIAAATMLIVAIATPFGRTWALALEYVAFVAFGEGAFLLFLVFPSSRLEHPGGRRVALVSAGAAVMLIVSYACVFAYSPGTYSLLKGLTFVVAAGDLIGAVGCAVTSVMKGSARGREARRSLGLVAFGTLAGVMPFCLLTLSPYLLGFGYVVHPDVAILSLGLLPISLGVAILSREFLGIDRLVRRGLVALVVWLALVAGYAVGSDILYNVFVAQSGRLAGRPGFTLIEVAVVAATFPVLQRQLRRAIDRRLFHDVYDYAATLQNFGSEIVRLTTTEEIAAQVLRQLCETLDLRWAVVVVGSEEQTIARYCWGNDPDIRVEPTCPSIEATQGGRLGSMTFNQNKFVVPLVADGEAIGQLAVGSKRHDVDLLPEDQTLILTVAPLAASALKNSLLLAQIQQQMVVLTERERALAALSSRLMEAQEEERRRIALDLHDDPLQQAMLLVRELQNGPQDDWSRRCRARIEDIIASLRATCTGLRPPALDDLGLVGGLEWLASNVAVRSDLETSVIVVPEDRAALGRLEGPLEVALFRVAQEALNNCLKHARATQVTVTMERGEDQVLLRIADDGTGCRGALAPGDDPGHLGILGLCERLRPWGGTLSVDAGEPGGTVVTARVPLGGGNGDGG